MTKNLEENTNSEGIIENFLKKAKKTQMSQVDWGMFFHQLEIEINKRKKTLSQKVLNNQNEVFLEGFIEANAPLLIIKALFESSKLSSANKDLYKWACGFSSLEVIDYLQTKLQFRDIPGAITATIINCRPDVLLHLLKQGYPIFQEKYLCQAMARSTSYNNNTILDIYLTNLESIKDLSSYAVVEAKKFLEPEQVTEINATLMKIKLEKEMSVTNQEKSKVKIKI